MNNHPLYSAVIQALIASSAFGFGQLKVSPQGSLPYSVH